MTTPGHWYLNQIQNPNPCVSSDHSYYYYIVIIMSVCTEKYQHLAGGNCHASVTLFRRMNRFRRCHTATHAFKIDRRYHMNKSLERQEHEHASILRFASSPCAPADPLFQLRSLHGLQTLFEAVGSERLIVVIVYTASCGVCSRAVKAVDAVRREYGDHSGVLFCKHDAQTEYDTRSDVSKMYRISSVPTMLFFIDGALVRRSNPIRDVREGFGRRSSLDIEKELDSLSSTVSAMVADMLHRYHNDGDVVSAEY